VLVTLLVARPVAVAIALAGTRVSRAALAFMAWFGPKGVATMTFSLLVLASGVAAGERIFNLAALVVLCSIVAHGLSDTPGSEWMARRAEAEAEAAARSGAASRASGAAPPAPAPSGTPTPPASGAPGGT
jgi:sodium/hydrogen antiporter